MLLDPAFIARHRRSACDFTRERKLGFAHTVLFLMNFLKGALQFELDSFFAALQGSMLPCREVTKSAFSQARRKLRYEAFIELNEQVLAGFYAEAPVRRWEGRRLLAIDGTTLRLPDSADVRALFEGPAEEVPQAHLVELYDVLNHLALAAECSPTYMGETFHAEQLLWHAEAGDLVLYDRGFPGFYLMALHRQRDIDFCMRVATTQFKATAAFAATSLPEQWLEIAPSGKVRSECRRDGLDPAPLRVRLVRVALASGETEILITSLGNEIPAAVFADLYHRRWGIEEAYKLQKCRLELENFSGRTAEAVLQEVHAGLLAANLAAIAAFDAQPRVDQATAQRRYHYRVNTAALLSKMKHFVARCLYALDDLQMQILRWLDWVAADAEPVRPERSSPRKSGLRPDRFRGNHKRCA